MLVGCMDVGGFWQLAVIAAVKWTVAMWPEVEDEEERCSDQAEKDATTAGQGSAERPATPDGHEGFGSSS